MRSLELLWESNPAKVMAKNYDEACDVCLVEWEWLDCIHCQFCHEIFDNQRLYEMHRNGKTGGCRNPANLDRFYREDYYPDLSVWHQKAEQKERSNG